jgi:probable HAF family extracellular repeat protein
MKLTKGLHVMMKVVVLLMLAAAPLHADTIYSFTTIDVPGATGTAPEGINNAGQIVGFDGDTVGTQHGFLLSGGIYTPIDVPGALPGTTRAFGINDAGQIVGDSVSHSFLLSGGIYTTIDVPGALSTKADGINNAGQIVGGSSLGGFLLSGGMYTTIDFPGAPTSPSGINDSGQIVGFYVDFRDRDHGFLLSGGVYTTIDFGPRETVADGINNAGQIVGYYYLSGNHGFLLSGGVYTTIDFPGATGTDITGINNAGQIVGAYSDGSGTHGFLATPVPEPGTFTLTLLGVGTLGVCRLRKRRATKM